MGPWLLERLQPERSSQPRTAAEKAFCIMTRNESNGRGPLQRTEVLLEVVFRAFEQEDATPDQDDQG